MFDRQSSFSTYVDWLEELRQQGGAWKFVTKKREFPLNTFYANAKKPRSYEEIFSSVLTSPKVTEAIEEEAVRRGLPVLKIQEDAKSILKIMAHNWGLSSTRTFGYVLVKVLERIFDAIYVNVEQLKRIRELCRSESIVFMPSHRTYLDFLLLSVFCFDYEVPLPAIAAGMDFANSWFMSEILRRCGAFYIKRSIGQDRLYWAILSEYVQTHIIHSERPVEFFIEGTRSRVGKSLYPKYGLLQMVLEPFLKGKVYDIVVIPVTTNYDKLLEELPYSYELLGFPKPKESTTALIKAHQFLNERYGRCFMTFGEPISVRDYFGMSLNRSSIVNQVINTCRTS
ncbi:Acyltransferase [Dictyocaulus viviparus]|uniref:Acyltransferase n=1 Tax=Dictyocaulus viviparus TaxID=29172 RepID=A0A0D8Y0A8_DICVI|nr:Acyltransferase [Dictyocaulus viviparus]